MPFLWQLHCAKNFYLSKMCLIINFVLLYKKLTKFYEYGTCVKCTCMALHAIQQKCWRLSSAVPLYFSGCSEYSYCHSAPTTFYPVHGVKHDALLQRFKLLNKNSILSQRFSWLLGWFISNWPDCLNRYLTIITS